MPDIGAQCSDKVRLLGILLSSIMLRETQIFLDPGVSDNEEEQPAYADHDSRSFGHRAKSLCKIWYAEKQILSFARGTNCYAEYGREKQEDLSGSRCLVGL